MCALTTMLEEWAHMGTRHSLASQPKQNSMLQAWRNLPQKTYLERNKRVKVKVAVASIDIHSQLHHSQGRIYKVRNCLTWGYLSDPSTQEAKAGRPRVQGQNGLHSKAPSQNKKLETSWPHFGPGLYSERWFPLPNGRHLSQE